jgi:hypothetical protein
MCERSSALGLQHNLENDMNPKTQRIRALNDELRQYLIGGGAVITVGVAALGRGTVECIVRAIAIFNDFLNDNDPYGEHDFGMLEVNGQTIIFKIDYYDSTLSQHSPDPSNPAVTERIITIMLDSEY